MLTVTRNIKDKNPLAKALLYVSIGLYLMSLSQHCVFTSQAENELGQGLLFLITGVFYSLSSSAGLTWFANPLLFISWLNIWKNTERSMYAVLIATCLSLYFLTVKELTVNEGGTVSPILKLQLGYWLWVSSTILTGLSSIIQYFVSRNKLP